MNIIQSYIPWRNPNKIDLDKKYIYTMMLSSLLLKKNYDTVTLYTNETQQNFLEKFNFPYTYNTDLLKDDTADVFAITKLKTMLSQTDSEFIHFDLDSFVFSNPKIKNTKSPFIFSHNDIGFLINDVSIKDTIEEIIDNHSFDAIYNTYLKFYLRNKKIIESIDGYPFEYISYKEIPNMNFIYVSDTNIFKEAIQKSLEVYQKIKKDIDSEWIGSAFIEQFTLPLYLKKLSKEYRDNIDESTLFKNSPLQLDDKSDKFYFSGGDYCSKCNHLHNINEEIQLTEPAEDFSKFSYYHCGGDKNRDIVQFLVIKTLVNQFGKEVVENIHEVFRDISFQQNISNKLSVGEILYEKYTHSDIFTKLNKKSIF